VILTASEFIEIGEKYGYKIKYHEEGYYWLMPGDRTHFIAHYQKCNDDTHYIQVARNFEYEDGNYFAQNTFFVKNDVYFEDEVRETIKQYKEGMIKYKKEVIEDDFKTVHRTNERL